MDGAVLFGAAGGAVPITRTSLMRTAVDGAFRYVARHKMSFLHLGLSGQGWRGRVFGDDG